MNIQKNELFKSGVKNLNAAMDKLKFNSSMTAEDAEKVRGNIQEARTNISALADVQPDHNGQFSALLEMANVLEKAVNAVHPSLEHMI